MVRHVRGADQAASPVVGTIILVAVVATVTGALALGAVQAFDGASPAPPVGVQVRGFVVDGEHRGSRVVVSQVPSSVQGAPVWLALDGDMVDAGRLTEGLVAVVPCSESGGLVGLVVGREVVTGVYERVSVHESRFDPCPSADTGPGTGGGEGGSGGPGGAQSGGCVFQSGVVVSVDPATGKRSVLAGSDVDPGDVLACVGLSGAV